MLMLARAGHTATSAIGSEALALFAMVMAERAVMPQRSRLRPAEAAVHLAGRVMFRSGSTEHRRLVIMHVVCTETAALPQWLSVRMTRLARYPAPPPLRCHAFALALHFTPFGQLGAKAFWAAQTPPTCVAEPHRQLVTAIDTNAMGSLVSTQAAFAVPTAAVGGSAPAKEVPATHPLIAAIAHTRDQRVWARPLFAPAISTVNARASQLGLMLLSVCARRPMPAKRPSWLLLSPSLTSSCFVCNDGSCMLVGVLTLWRVLACCKWAGQRAAAICRRPHATATCHCVCPACAMQLRQRRRWQ